MNNKRKNRAVPQRAPRVRSVTAEGVYKNAHFMHAIASHVGDFVQVHTRSGSIWEGVFRTFSAHFEVVIEVAHEVVHGVVSPDSIVDKMIFKPDDVISIKAKDSDLDYATRDSFQTDSAISKFNGRGGGSFGEERALQPWVGEAMNGDALEGSRDALELDSCANGWDANDMFRKNEQVYGVHSTYDHALTGYTLQLQKKDTQDYRDAEAKAEEIAAEIEKQPNYKQRMDVENGDEEEQFAAVVRPGHRARPSPTPPPPASNGSEPPAGDKYVPPGRRKNLQSGKPLKSPQVSQSPHQSGREAGKGPGAHYPPLPLHPQHTPHQVRPPSPTTYVMQVHPMSMGGGPPAKSYAAAGAAQAPPHPYHTPPPFTTHHVHGVQSGGPGSGSGKVNGAEAKLPPLQQRAPRHAAPPAPFPPPHQPSHPEPPVQVMPHQVNMSEHMAPPAPPHMHPQPPRHREQRRDEVQDLKKFGHEFKLPPEVSANSEAHLKPSSPPVAHPPHREGPSPHAQHPQHPTHDLPKQPPMQDHKVLGPAEVSAEAPSASAPVDKVTACLKNSTLNPEAKEFNPAVRPFVPRSPSTPNPSRPHTPATPVQGGPAQYLGGAHHPAHHAAQHHQHHLGGAAQQQAYAAVVHPHHAPPPPAYHPPPHHPHSAHRFRKMPMASQMQVAAATGQPLLAPAPLQQYMPYHQPHQPPPQYPHMVRMYHQHEAGGGVQYLAPPPAPSTPSPGQAGYHAPPSPAVGPAPPYQPPPFQVLCLPPQQHHLYLPPQAPPPQAPPQHPQHLQVLLQPPQGGPTPGPGHGGHP